MKNQLSPVRSANFSLYQANAVHFQEVSNGLDIALAKTIYAATERYCRQRAAEDPCLERIALGSKIEHSLQQRSVSHVRVSTGILAILRTFRQHKVVRAANASIRIPKAERNAGTHDGVDGERLRGSEDFARDEIMPRVFVV